MIILTAGTVIAMLSVLINDHLFEPGAVGKIFLDLAVMLGLLGAIVMLDGGGILYTILAIVNTICCFVLSRYAGGIKIIRFVTGFATCVVIVIAMGLVFFSDYGYVDYKIVSKYGSPDGSYTAEVIDSDNKIEGAQVRVRKNTVMGLPVSGILDITKQLTNASGDAEPEYYAVEWIDTETLSINGYKESF